MWILGLIIAAFVGFLFAFVIAPGYEYLADQAGRMKKNNHESHMKERALPVPRPDLEHEHKQTESETERGMQMNYELKVGENELVTSSAHHDSLLGADAGTGTTEGVLHLTDQRLVFCKRNTAIMCASLAFGHVLGNSLARMHAPKKIDFEVETKDIEQVIEKKVLISTSASPLGVFSYKIVPKAGKGKEYGIRFVSWPEGGQVLAHLAKVGIKFVASEHERSYVRAMEKARAKEGEGIANAK
jgi:hypothetical protein